MKNNKDFLLYANSSIEDALKKLETSAQGLSEQQAKKRLAMYGRNELQDTTVTWFDILKNQIRNPFILIFIILIAIYFFLQQYTEGIILLILMVINTVVGFYQEVQHNLQKLYWV